MGFHWKDCSPRRLLPQSGHVNNPLETQNFCFPDVTAQRASSLELRDLLNRKEDTSHFLAAVTSVEKMPLRE
ncbi:hypothetical protein CapIbe_023155 [Capra ibex]